MAHLQDDAVSELTALTQYFVACTEYGNLHWQVLLHHILPGEPFWPSHKRIIQHVPRDKTKYSVPEQLNCKPVFNAPHRTYLQKAAKKKKYLKINCNTYNVRVLQCCQKTNFKWNFPSKCRIFNPWLLMDFMFLNELSYHLNARKAIKKNTITGRSKIWNSKILVSNPQPTVTFVNFTHNIKHYTIIYEVRYNY